MSKTQTCVTKSSLMGECFNAAARVQGTTYLIRWMLTRPTGDVKLTEQDMEVRAFCCFMGVFMSL